MKIIKSTILYSLYMIMLTLPSCTQNDGHIGRLFGAWKMVEVTANGESMQLPDDTYYVWAFQNSVSLIKEIHSDFTLNEFWASWSDTGDCIVLNYDNHDNEVPPGGWLYQSAESIGFAPSPCIISLRKLEFTSSRLRFEYINPDNGVTYIYSLKKLY